VPPQWRQEQEQKHLQEQQQQEQQQQKNEMDNHDQDQLQEELRWDGSSQGGRLQNFQKNIHQFDQQQQEMELLQQQQEMERLQPQQQQQQHQQQDLQQTDSEVNTSGGANDAFSTTLFDTDGFQKPDFSGLNRNDPKVGEFADAGVDGSTNNAKIDQKNLVYEDGNGFNGNTVAGDSSNMNSFGNNFVEQNAGFNNGIVQNGNHNVGDQSGFHQGVDHNDDLDSISSNGVNNFQGGGAVPNGVDDRIDGKGIVDVNNRINNIQGDALHPKEGDSQNDQSGFVDDNLEIDKVEGVSAFANGVDEQEDNDGSVYGNNGVNNLQGGASPNEVHDQMNSNGFVSEFTANSPGYSNQGTNQQFDQEVSEVQNKFYSIEKQNPYNPLYTNTNPMRQFDNRFLPPHFMSNSERNFFDAHPNLIQTAASQKFEQINNNDRSNADQFNHYSIERQSSNAFDFYGDQENFGQNAENLGALAELDSNSRLLEDKHNLAKDFIGGQSFRNNPLSLDATVSDGDSNAGSIVQADFQEQADFRQDSDIRQEDDIRGQVHVLLQADLQGQHDYPDGAGSQLQANFQQNFGSNTQKDIVPPEQIFSRQEESLQEVDGSEEQYDHQQVDHLLESSEFHNESTAQEQADFYEGRESHLELAEPTEQRIQSGQKDGLQDLNELTLDAVSQEQTRYQPDSNGQQQNIFQEEVKNHEQLNSRQHANSEGLASLDDEAELEELAGEVEELAEGLEYKVEEFQPHSHVQYQTDSQPQQQQIEQEENTESLLLSGNLNKNQIDSGDTTDKNEIAVGGVSDNQSNPVVTQSETLNRAPQANGRNMADDVDLPPNGEQGQRSIVQESAQFVEKSQTNGEQNDQVMRDSQQLSQIIVGNGMNVDSGIQGMIQQSERIFDTRDEQSDPGTVMEQHVDMDAYVMSPFGGLNDGHVSGAEPTFQHVPQGKNEMAVSLEGQKPESIGLQDQGTRVQGFPSVSEYYSSIRKKSAHGNMIAEGEKTLLQKRREQRQQLRQQ